MTDDDLRKLLATIRCDPAGHVALPADYIAKIIEDALRFRHIKDCTSFSASQRRVYLEWSGDGADQPTEAAARAALEAAVREAIDGQ